MTTIHLSTTDLDELILIMQMSSYDADTAIQQSHDRKEIEALRQHKKTLAKWRKRFQDTQKEGNNHAH